MIHQQHAFSLLWFACIGLSTQPQASASQLLGNDGEVLLQTASEIHRVGLNGSMTFKESVTGHCNTVCTMGSLFSDNPIEILVAASGRSRFQMTTAMGFADDLDVTIGELNTVSMLSKLWYWDDEDERWRDTALEVTGPEAASFGQEVTGFHTPRGRRFRLTLLLRQLFRLKRILNRIAMCFAYQDDQPPDDEVPDPAPAPDLPGAVGDPHITNLKGEKFDINQPGKHLLLRAPFDPQQPALLELSAEVETDGGPCSMYVKMATLSGSWLGDKVVRIRPRQRNGTTFALQVSAKGHAGSWKPWGPNVLTEISQSGEESLPEVVRVSRGRRREGKMKWEARVFVLHIGTATNIEDRAEIQVSESPHYALDITLNHMKSLGEHKLGGILGSEGHDTSIEELTEECEAKKRQTSPRKKTAVTPYLAAFWANDESGVEFERETA